ncbi:hypothetical protein NDU88_003935 [Pleurodeles waltl]|uniref:Uncharacterized protein n=1 Tax=Pleurodeles waltl TaxID=8319 RepID=A0AAV7L780_PLEWA|nr:hypothetical protein NDU88_003935 [Pleurodeles waltl]
MPVIALHCGGGGEHLTPTWRPQTMVHAGLAASDVVGLPKTAAVDVPAPSSDPAEPDGEHLVLWGLPVLLSNLSPSILVDVEPAGHRPSLSDPAGDREHAKGAGESQQRTSDTEEDTSE